MQPCCLRLCAARFLKNESNQRDRKKGEQTGKMIQGVLFCLFLLLCFTCCHVFWLFFLWRILYTQWALKKFSSRKGCKPFYFLIQIKPLWKKMFSFFFRFLFSPLVLGLILNIHFEKHGKASNVGKCIETCIWEKKKPLVKTEYKLGCLFKKKNQQKKTKLYFGHLKLPPTNEKSLRCQCMNLDSKCSRDIHLSHLLTHYHLWF